MKVICIMKAGGFGPFPVIEVGTELTVELEEPSPNSGVLHYCFIEIPKQSSGHAFFYASFRFAKCDGPCEISLHEQRIDAEIAEMEMNYAEVELDEEARMRMWKRIEAHLDKTEGS